MGKKKSLDIYKNWKRITVVVNDLELDPDNVRIGLEASERSKIDQGSLINDLFDNEYAFQILESVVEDGWFIDEIPIVIKARNKHIVVEGNRRIAALKVLQNPALAPSYYAKVKPLSDSVVPIKQIGVLVAPNRDEISGLLASRHTKTTTRPWRPLRQAHFYYSQLSKKTSVKNLKDKYKGVDIESFIRMCEVHKIAASYEFGDITTNNKVREQRTFPVSTVERLYDDFDFREYLNFDFNNDGRIVIKSSRKRFDEEFKKVILDAIDKKINTRTLNTEANRKKYYESNLDKLKKTSRQTKSSSYTPKAPKKGKRSKTIGIFDRSLTCTINCKGVEKVFDELQKINYGDGKFPNATHDLMRSFLEAVLKEYLKKKKHPLIPNKQGGFIYFKQVLKETEKYLRARSEHQVRQIVTMLIRDYKELFDCINHNPSIFSNEKKVKDTADQMSDLIKYIFEDYK
ncbi:MAG: hypothetical protein O7D86_00310 [Proteobacteria bacterium]|nr:hypothetical protein [Pseudomonadota bacterium]